MSEIIRPARVEDAEAIGWISVTAWRETYAGIMPDDYLAALSIEQRAAAFRDGIAKPGDKQAIFVALDGTARVVGFAVSGPTREVSLGTDGEIFAINLVAAAKRQGLGLRLMAAMAAHLSNQNFSQAGLWVIDQNASARRFYETLDGHETTRKTQIFGAKSVLELGYAWHSVEELVSSTRQLLRRRV